jgi:hypothetical protein
MSQPYTDAELEPAARVVASRSNYGKHGQRCPVWTNRPRGVVFVDGSTPGEAELASCNCWIMPNARSATRAVLAAVLAEHDARVRADERARVRQMVEAERLVDDTGNAADIGYNQAIDDVLCAIDTAGGPS